MNNPEFVALGTQCTAATILNLTNTRKNAYPFDWIDQPIESILKLVKIPKSTDIILKEWLNDYFNEVRSQRHPDGSWFPHDFVATDNPLQQLWEIKEKYFRRFRRMFDLFESDRDIIFLTVFKESNSKDIFMYNRLVDYLTNTISGKCLFVSINLYQNNIVYEVSPAYNFYVPFNGDWPTFDQNIISALKSHPLTHGYF